MEFFNQTLNIILGLERYFLPLALLACGILLGFIVEKIILLRIKKVALKFKWEGGSVVLHSLKGITFLWFTLAGLYGALRTVDFISHHYEKLDVDIVFDICQNDIPLL